jgi:hypothetical protein
LKRKLPQETEKNLNFVCPLSAFFLYLPNY